jgi:hypothetical protein
VLFEEAGRVASVSLEDALDRDSSSLKYGLLLALVGEFELSLERRSHDGVMLLLPLVLLASESSVDAESLLWVLGERTRSSLGVERKKSMLHNSESSATL